MKTVMVLLSTYNGEKYIREQIESVLKQEGVNIQLFVRDDGSKDSTVKILEDYAKKDKRVRYYIGQNVGPAKSFLDLIRNSEKSDYYAFCDQDDVWDKNKLVCAVSLLEKRNKLIPLLYYSNLRIVDKNLQFYRMSHHTPHIQKSKYEALLEPLATGCTVVFNNIAAKLIQSRLPKECSMHDSWVYLVCKFFGETVYDYEAHIDYRQHENNVVGTYLGKKTIAIYISRFKRLFNRNLQPRYHNAQNFLECFGDMLCDEDRKKVEKIVNYKKTLKNRINLLLDKEIHALNFSRDMRYRILIILGIV